VSNTVLSVVYVVNLLLSAYNNQQPGDPAKGVQAILDVVRGDGAAKDKSFPKSLQLGSDCFAVVKNSAEQTLNNLDAWKDMTFSTNHD